MRKLFAILALCALTQGLHAQCNKHVIYTSVKEIFTNAKDEGQKEEQDKITVEVSDKQVMLIHEDEIDQAMKATITNMQCAWTEPYKNGKTTINATVDNSGEVQTVLVIIEAIDGNMVITLTLNDGDMKIKAFVDKHEEVAK